mgnify:CR=1 FL=1
MKLPGLLWERTTFEEQELDVLLYSKSLSHRERFHLLSELQKTTYPEIYKDHKAYYKKSLSAPIQKRKLF